MNHWRQPQRVLVADDEPEIRKLVERTIHDIAPTCRVRQVSNGLATKEKLLMWSPQLVVLDLHMPRIDGLELAEFIQSNRYLSHTKVLIITGYPAPGIHETVFERGASEFLIKPFDVNDLRASLWRLLR